MTSNGLMRRREAIIGSTAAVVGAALAYFLDPDRGRSRRTRLRDRYRAFVRKPLRRVSGRANAKARYARGRAHGLVHRATHRRPQPVDDATLTDKVRSEVLGYPPFAGHGIAVDAAGRCVTLRGELETVAEIETLERRVHKVAGVREVRNFVHLRGTPPPNKLEALRADAGSTHGPRSDGPLRR
jgi:hypothetical protein